MRLPKGLHQKGNFIYFKYYDPSVSRTREESTGLLANAANVKAAKEMREEKIRALKKPRSIFVVSYLTITQGLEQFLATKRYAPKTASIFTDATRYFVEANGDLIIGNVSSYDDMKLNEYWERRLKVNSQSIYSRALATMFAWFVQKKYTTENPITRIPMQRTEVKAIPKKDLDLILGTLQKENIEGYYLIKFLYLTGLRVGEAISLEWKNIDLENRLLRFWNQKSKRFDKRPFLLPALEVLTEIKLNTNRERLFLHSDTSCLFFYRTQARLWGERLPNGRLKEKILRKYHLHQLRKTFISALVASGIKFEDTMQYSGHKDSRTMVYHYIEYNYKKINERVDPLVEF